MAEITLDDAIKLAAIVDEQARRAEASVQKQAEANLAASKEQKTIPTLPPMGPPQPRLDFVSEYSRSASRNTPQPRRAGH